ncbi:MAG: radical SAM family heme chaperone HemW [Anaerolineae bacterium]|nr:radical SAM family heme chaperone HemW [Anaerolineae bacterium]
MITHNPSYTTDPSPLALYIHIPFCPTRCSYCAFNTYTGLDDLVPAYVEALCGELTWAGQAGGHPAIHTIYFGGGTPGVLSPLQLDRVLSAARAAFVPVEPLEVTLETNPAAVTLAYCLGVHEAGVNRLSLGAQSAIPAELRLFRRRHEWQDVIDAVAAGRRAGFDNISLDLIYGAPGQTLASWRRTLAATLALEPDHLSLYSLSVEPGTALEIWVRRGQVTAPDPDRAADMYEAASEVLAGHGFEQYEISNWARPGYACRHNLQYWRNLPYLGIGAGAYGYAGHVRYMAVESPQRYIRLLAEAVDPVQLVFPLSAAASQEHIEYVDAAQARTETVMLGLRLLQEGVSRAGFVARHGAPLEAYYGAALAKFSAVGLIELSDDRVRLTARARLVSNRVIEDFV